MFCNAGHLSFVSNKTYRTSILNEFPNREDCPTVETMVPMITEGFRPMYVGILIPLELDHIHILGTGLELAEGK